MLSESNKYKHDSNACKNSLYQTIEYQITHAFQKILSHISIIDEGYKAHWWILHVSYWTKLIVNSLRHSVTQLAITNQ